MVLKQERKYLYSIQPGRRSANHRSFGSAQQHHQPAHSFSRPEAALEIGRAELNIDNLETYSSQLQQWGKALSESASILLYGCNVAARESGMKFLQKIREFTGANIAASNNRTGNAALGGDWELEISTGQINTEVAFEKEVLEGYTSVLATLVNENFKDSVVVGPWIYGVGNTRTDPPGLTAGSPNPKGVIPIIGGDPEGLGTLRLTSNATFQAAFVIYDNPISATEGLRVTFDYFAYNRGTVLFPGDTIAQGADGLSFFLIDGTATPTKAGGYGGSLGYAQNTNLDGTVPGIVGGYLGIGLDEFGNYSSSVAGGKVGGFLDRKPDTVALRGSESTSYNFLGSQSVAIGIDEPSLSTRTNARRRVQVTLSPTISATPNRLTVTLDLDNDGNFNGANETLIDIGDVTTINGVVPTTFKFGFAASTGGNTNVHEVNNVLVESIEAPTVVADVSIVKKGPLVATPNSTITYTIIATNNGPNSAQSVLIQDQLPPALSSNPVTADNGGSFDSQTNTVRWPAIPTLANGESVTRTITATVPATLSAGTALTNTAFSSSSTFDPNLDNNNSSQPLSQVSTTIVDTSADLVTTKTGPATATAGSTVTYTISTQNLGPSAATEVTISDTIVPGLTSVVLSPGGTYNADTGIVTFQAIPSLPSGAAVANTLSFVAPNSGSVSNTASSSSPTPDPTPGNNNGGSPTATVTTNITPQADVVTTKTGPATATPGSTVTYTISTQNLGHSAATEVTISDSIVPGLTSVVVSNGTYNADTGIVTFQPITSLASGAAVANTVSFVAPNSGSVSNTASSSSPTPDPTPGNNNGGSPTATVTTNITPQADVVTTKTGPATATAGSTVTYTISTQNLAGQAPRRRSQLVTASFRA